jgi:chaperonin GroES
MFINSDCYKENIQSHEKQKEKLSEFTSDICNGIDCAYTEPNNDNQVKPINLIKMAEVKLKPLADRVLVEPKEAETKTASGIFIPDTAREKPQQGKVIAVGPGLKDEKMEVKVGDLVLYGKYSGTEITVEGKDYLIMKQADILAIV